MISWDLYFPAQSICLLTQLATLQALLVEYLFYGESCHFGSFDSTNEEIWGYKVMYIFL